VGEREEEVRNGIVIGTVYVFVVVAVALFRENYSCESSSCVEVMVEGMYVLQVLLS